MTIIQAHSVLNILEVKLFTTHRGVYNFVDPLPPRPPPLMGPQPVDP